MNLSRFAYISRAATYFDTDLLSELVEHSSTLNAMSHLTGFLTYHQNHFFQYLEGPRDSLGETWQRIEDDKRHSIQEVHRMQPIKTRMFASWNMRFLEHARIKTFFTAESVAVDLVEDVIAPRTGLSSVWEWKVEQIVEVVARTMQSK